MAKVTATFETDSVLCYANSSKTTSRAHVQGAEMSTVEKRFLSFIVYTDKYILYWQIIAIRTVATYDTITSLCISLSQWMSRGPEILMKTEEKESTSKCNLELK